VTRLRVACVGSGFIASKHLSALAGFDDVTVVAVADPIPERVAEAATHFSARAYTDGEELLLREELDAVWLCVPPFAHGRLEHVALELSGSSTG
jgi:myo-inositol 2-dehydrogenase / D-chiro-inositol 1-dehydrogenase